MARLVIIAGPAEGQSIECDRELMFGREGVDVVIDDAQMSRRHAAIRPGPGGTEVEDLGSRNGTFVDGSRITGKVVLTQPATIRMGKSEVALVIAADELAAAEGGISDIAMGETKVAGARPVFDVPERTTIRNTPPVQPPNAPPPPIAPPASPAGGAPAAGPGALPGADLPGVGLPGVGLPGVGMPAGAGDGGGGRRRHSRGQGLPPRVRIVLPFLVGAIAFVIVWLLLH